MEPMCDWNKFTRTKNIFTRFCPNSGTPILYIEKKLMSSVAFLIIESELELLHMAYTPSEVYQSITANIKS